MPTKEKSGQRRWPIFRRRANRLAVLCSAACGRGVVARRELDRLIMVAAMTEGVGPGFDAAALADELRELSASCEQHVRDAVGLALDGSIETLPILDHYVRLSAAASRDRPELLPLLARTVGAYFGQVVADHFGGFWLLPSPDVSTWYVCLRSVYVAFNPIGMAHAALTWSLEPESSLAGPPAELHLARKDRQWVEQRLAALPPVRESDFFSLSTRVEGMEIAVAALAEQMAEAGMADVIFDDDDYSKELGAAGAGSLLN